MQRNKTKNVLLEIHVFRRTTLSVVTDSCYDIFTNAGYTFDDSNITIEQTVYGSLGKHFSLKKNLDLTGAFISCV